MHNLSYLLPFSQIDIKWEWKNLETKLGCGQTYWELNLYCSRNTYNLQEPLRSGSGRIRKFHSMMRHDIRIIEKYFLREKNRELWLWETCNAEWSPSSLFSTRVEYNINHGGLFPVDLICLNWVSIVIHVSMEGGAGTWYRKYSDRRPDCWEEKGINYQWVPVHASRKDWLGFYASRREGENCIGSGEIKMEVFSVEMTWWLHCNQ
jgi:hypothetical protein